MGIAYVKDGRLIVYRSITELNKLIKHYNKAYELDSPVLMHFRIATTGEVHERNCHPFFLDGDSQMCVAHNGVIDFPGLVRGTYKGTYSDTVQFKNKFLKPLFAQDPEFLDSSEIRALIEKYIGASKLVFLRASGRLDILNESKGHWEDGVWYSNHSYLNSSRFFRNHLSDWYMEDDDNHKVNFEVVPSTVKSTSRDNVRKGKAKAAAKPPTRILQPQDEDEGEKCCPFALLPPGSGSLTLGLSDKDKHILNAQELLHDINDPKAVKGGCLYHGRVLCWGCLPTAAIISGDIVSLFNDFNSVFVCDQCRRPIHDEDDTPF